MTVKDFSEKVGLTKRSIYRHIKAGKIATVKHPLSKTLIIPETEARRIIKAIRAE